MKRWSVMKMLVPWFVLFAVTSCGPMSLTGDNNELAGGGIGGTGISVGKITAAVNSSVSVNGVAFDTTNASVTVDGMVGNRSNLKVGMIVKVDGIFNQDGTTGVAVNIEFKDILEGPVGSVVSNTLVVLGQTVSVSSSTIFDDFPDINGDGLFDVNDIMEGNIVEVSGFVDASGVIHATYISRKAASIVSDGFEIELKGTIAKLDSFAMTFTIGSLTIEYNSNTEFKDTSAEVLKNGLYVEVKSSAGTIGNVLIASKIELEDEGHNLDEGDEFEVEGFVTDTSALLAENKFKLEGQTVLITSNTKFENGINIDNIIVNVKLEVEGTVDAYGVLVADKIEIKAGDDGDSDDSGDDSDIDSEDDSSESDHLENGENDPS
mgnify:CR=1 FL=1